MYIQIYTYDFPAGCRSLASTPEISSGIKERLIIEKYSLKQALTNARNSKTAIGAFNIFNYASAQAVISAGESLGLPVLLQTSVSTVKKFGVEALISMLNGLKSNAATPVMIHLDHCRDKALAMQCVDAGWDSVMFDGSALPFEQNVQLTREVVLYAHSKGCEVEGELGTIVGTEDDISVSKAAIADYENSLRFIEQTGVDVFAPAIGTAHGTYKSAPCINFDIVKRLSSDVATPIVIHGGTGLADSVFRQLIECGGSKINISTALKVGYLDGTCRFFKKGYPIDPLLLDAGTENELFNVAVRHMRVFSGAKQA